MNRTKEVFLSVVMSVSGTLCAQTRNEPPLQKGVSVQMAVTEHATQMPDADSSDACVITVTASGDFYVRADPVSPRDNLYYDTKSCLYEARKKNPTSEPRLYIKADARALAAYLDYVLAAASGLDHESAILLTAQPVQKTEGTRVAPTGLEIRATSSWRRDSMFLLLDSDQSSPKIRFNDQGISLDDLQNQIKLLQARRDPLVISMESKLPFAKLATVLDLCSSLGATVSVALPRVQ